MDDIDKAKQTAIDFGVTFNSEHGVRVKENLDAYCLRNDSTFDADNTHQTAFNEGARSVVLYIEHVIAYKPPITNRDEVIIDENSEDLQLVS